MPGEADADDLLADDRCCDQSVLLVSVGTLRDGAVDLRGLDHNPDAAVTSLILSLSCRSCRSCRAQAPFAQLVRLSRTGIADELRDEHTRRVLGE